tara:strand:- start:587 stop:784 length:198 start_codon:yes stop_codon:yes gene_type:complete
MKAPMPIDELPSFIAKSNGTVQPGSNPWLKFIIVGGILLVGLFVSASIMKTAVVNNNKIKPKENE